MRMIWILMLLSVPMYVYGQTAPQDSVHALGSLLKDGSIKRVEILRLPDEVLTRIRVTPEALRSTAYYKVIFYKDLESSFGSLLSDASVKSSSQTSDLRWGVLFYGNSNQEIGSIFVDHFGVSGYVNSETVIFGSNLSKRLRQMIRELR